MSQIVDDERATSKQPSIFYRVKPIKRDEIPTVTIIIITRGQLKGGKIVPKTKSHRVDI